MQLARNLLAFLPPSRQSPSSASTPPRIAPMHAFHRHLARPALALVLALAAAPALAHPTMARPASPAAWRTRSGLDHLLAMLAVGLFAARQRGGRAGCCRPASCWRCCRRALSAAGIALPAVETGIAASVLVFGLLIASLARLPLTAALPLVATFALFHGHAHHAEMGAGSAFAYTRASHSPPRRCTWPAWASPACCPTPCRPLRAARWRWRDRGRRGRPARRLTGTRGGAPRRHN